MIINSIFFLERFEARIFIHLNSNSIYIITFIFNIQFTHNYNYNNNNNNNNDNNNNTQIAAILLPPSTTHPQLWVELLTYYIMICLV